MEFELVFNGTPAQFGVMADNFSNRLYSKLRRAAFVVTVGEKGFLIPNDANPVAVRFGGPDASAVWEFGWATAQSVPGGKSLLVVNARDEHWPQLVEWWELLRSEMERQGWLTVQPEMGDAPSIVQVQHVDNVQVFAPGSQQFNQTGGVNIASGHDTTIGQDAVGGDKLQSTQ